MKLDDINDVLFTTLDSENYDSIGGILIETLDRLPTPGEEIQLPDGTKLAATAVNKNRIEKVTLTLPKPEETKEASSKTAVSTEKSERTSEPQKSFDKSL